MNKEEMQQRVTDIIFNSGNTVSKPMIIDVVKFCKEYATQQCAAKDAENERLKVELENVRLYFSLTEIEFDNLKINNNDKYL